MDEFDEDYYDDDDGSGWIDCWNGCEDGYFDGYEEDPLWFDPGDLEVCHVCKGQGGWSRKPQIAPSTPNTKTDTTRLDQDPDIDLRSE